MTPRTQHLYSKTALGGTKPKTLCSLGRVLHVWLSPRILHLPFSVVFVSREQLAESFSHCPISS